ncbi:GDSL-type esterase/lipase family protein [Sphingomonas arantia]|uniref:Chitooligosaccharide deacetylase n=1 Tax=Sphingomonas arantia TaxID=1460676 RepID=A0ABW4TW94_9SPHN
MKRWPTALIALALFPALVGARAAPDAPRRADWIASWGTSQMVADGDNALPAIPADGITLRQVVRLSAGGRQVRVRLSNMFGKQPLVVAAAHLARPLAPGTARTDAGVPLTFSGRPGTTIPAGAELYSDPVTMPVAPGADLAISLHLPAAPAPQTGHPGSRATSFTLPGAHVADPVLAGAATLTHWYVIADVEVSDPASAGTVVTIGDSITDGYGVLPNTNTRWSDVLAQRLRGNASTRTIGVVNAGIGGNRILLDGLGPNLLARFDRDVIARTGVRWAIVLEGVNDLGVLTREAPATPAQHAALVADVTAAYRQMADRAHAHGIRLIGGTITPLIGNDYYHAGPETEADRQAINRFIRTSGTFDAVIDFDRIVRDPARPDRLAPAFDSGDHLHPSPAGYRTMGEAVPLTLFAASASAARGKAPPPTIALTFDDIPSHGPLPPGETRVGVIRAITTALSRAKAPAFGFLNAVSDLDDADSRRASEAWRAAGLPLGNHTYSHPNLDEVGPVNYAADIAKNEPPLAKLARGTDWHWFRYPYLSEGTAPAAREAIRADLRRRGYRIAAVTMSFSDYEWNEPYAACAARHDSAAIAKLDASFLAGARTGALAARERAQTQLGRDVPYILLMHVGAMDARMLPRLLALYRSMGFRFTTLAAAQADPYYASANDLSLPGPTASLGGLSTMHLAKPPAGLCT